MTVQQTSKCNYYSKYFFPIVLICSKTLIESHIFSQYCKYYSPTLIQHLVRSQQATQIQMEPKRASIMTYIIIPQKMKMLTNHILLYYMPVVIKMSLTYHAACKYFAEKCLETFKEK